MDTLAIDIETYSDVDINLGVYKYVESENFKILLFAYSYNGAPVQVIDLTAQALPDRIVMALLDDRVIKTAFNAQFERVCLSKYITKECHVDFEYSTENSANFLILNAKSWRCTMIKAWNAGYSGGLDAVSKAMHIKEEEGKMREGKRLIRLFSKPQKPTKKRPSTAPYTKEELPEEWETFMRYCKRDVEVETYIREKLEWFHVRPPAEQLLYVLDQEINDRGIRIDLDMAKNAIRIDQDLMDHYTHMFQQVTGIDSPNQLGELKDWLNRRNPTGQPINKITKKNKDELYKKFEDDPKALTALECRYKTGRTSTAKYQTMLDATGKDGRMRGTLQFYGAQQTGRWAGRILQVQNLPQNHIDNLGLARAIVKEEDYEFLSLMYPDPGDVLSQCIRPCIIPSEGKKFVVSDFSAIEARVIAWLAGEDWVLDVFRTTGKIYEATAAQMLGIPEESVKKPSPERQKGKVATLACGYQGGVGALKAMGALDMGIPEYELQGIIDDWRNTHPRTVSLWRDVENAAKSVISNHSVRRINNKIRVFYNRGFVFIELPSGRLLSYPHMRIGESKRFPGMSQLIFGVVKSNGEWRWQETYGGRLVENIVQATARDCLAHSMLQLEEAGYPIVMHVHDEVVIEVDEEDDNAINEITEIMGEEIPWAPGLPLKADAYECSYYQKD